MSISSLDYKSISDNISDFIDQYINMYNDLNNILSLNNSISSSLMNSYTYAIENQTNLMLLDIKTNNTILYSEDLKSLGNSLQNHIINYYGDINSFLNNNSLKVKQTFADFSNSLGYEIDPSNIEI
jgi:hypothetical protein